MQLSKTGYKYLKEYENCRLTSYVCPAGVWTVGWGHTRTAYEGQHISQKQADDLLAADVREFELAVDMAVQVDLRQQQFDALVCLAFNIGAHGFAKSTLVKKLNTGDYLAAAMEFQRWSLISGKRSKGLLRRRFKTASLFLS